MKRTVSVPVVTHDPDHGGLSYIYLAGPLDRGSVARSVPVKTQSGDVVLDFDRSGALVGIELLGGSLLHPDLKRVSVPPGQEHS